MKSSDRNSKRRWRSGSARDRVPPEPRALSIPPSVATEGRRKAGISAKLRTLQHKSQSMDVRRLRGVRAFTMRMRKVNSLPTAAENSAGAELDGPDFQVAPSPPMESYSKNTRTEAHTAAVAAEAAAAAAAAEACTVDFAYMGSGGSTESLQFSSPLGPTPPEDVLADLIEPETAHILFYNNGVQVSEDGQPLLEKRAGGFDLEPDRNCFSPFQNFAPPTRPEAAEGGTEAAKRLESSLLTASEDIATSRDSRVLQPIQDALNEIEDAHVLRYLSDLAQRSLFIYCIRCLKWGGSQLAAHGIRVADHLVTSIQNTCNDPHIVTGCLELVTEYLNSCDTSPRRLLDICRRLNRKLSQLRTHSLPVSRARAAAPVVAPAPASLLPSTPAQTPVKATVANSPVAAAAVATTTTTAPRSDPSQDDMTTADLPPATTDVCTALQGSPAESSQSGQHSSDSGLPVYNSSAPDSDSEQAR